MIAGNFFIDDCLFAPQHPKSNFTNEAWYCTPLLLMEVVRKPNDADVESAHAIRVSHHTLLHHYSGNFSRFH